MAIRRRGAVEARARRGLDGSARPVALDALGAAARKQPGSKHGEQQGCSEE